MEILATILGLLPSLIQMAEAIYSKVPKSGEQKKEEVKGGIHGFAKTMAIVTTGGAKETWKSINALMPLIDANIDLTVNAMNNMGIFDKEHDSMGS